MNSTAFHNADILIPNNKTDMSKWAVIACDQYTSEPEYWDAVKAAFKADVVPNFHVNGGNEINKEPTATEDGAIGYVCDACGEEIILETIPATGEVTEAETTAPATTAAETPVNTACTRYATGARNMNANSSGSVTPVKKEDKAAAINKAPAAFFFSGFAV